VSEQKNQSTTDDSSVNAGETKETSDTSRPRSSTKRLPAHIMAYIVKFDGSLALIVAVSSCHRWERQVFRKHFHLDLTKRTLTKEQIMSCAQYFRITGLDLSSFNYPESQSKHLASIFQACASSLETLKLGHIDPVHYPAGLANIATSPPVHLLSNIPNVRHLVIGSASDVILGRDTDFNSDPLSFLQYLPKLEFLSIKSLPKLLSGNIKHFAHTPFIQNIDLPSTVGGNISVLRHLPCLRRISLREARRVFGDIVALQHCPNLEHFSVLRTRLHGDTNVVRTSSLDKLEKFDCQSTHISGKISDFRFCNNLSYLRYWGSDISSFHSIPPHDNGTEYSDQYKGLDICRWVARWSKESDEVREYERKWRPRLGCTICQRERRESEE
jgi:hypothetical protein